MRRAYCWSSAPVALPNRSRLPPQLPGSLRGRGHHEGHGGFRPRRRAGGKRSRTLDSGESGINESPQSEDLQASRWSPSRAWPLGYHKFSVRRSGSVGPRTGDASRCTRRRLQAPGEHWAVQSVLPWERRFLAAAWIRSRARWSLSFQVASVTALGSPLSRASWSFPST